MDQRFIYNCNIVFTPPLYLNNGRDYELAMVNLEAYYSFANIRADNNSLKWSGDGGKTWTALHIPTCCYELKAVNSEIIRMRGGNSGITILPNINTLQCILNVVGAKLKVSFDVPNSLASLLGFNRSTSSDGRHASGQLVNIMSVNSILVHCNIIHYSYMRSVYNFFPNGLTTGLLSGGISKAISGNGLFLQKHGKCHQVQKCKGDGLYLALHPPLVEGDGLFLKRSSDISDGAGLFMGKNSPFWDGYCNYLFRRDVYKSKVSVFLLSL